MISFLLVTLLNPVFADKTDVNIFYSEIHQSEIVEVTDSCGNKFALKIKNNDLLKSDKIDKWFKKLNDFNLLQDCE